MTRHCDSQTKGAIKQREELDELISSIQSTIDALLGRTLGEEKEYDQESVRAALMAGLRADIKYFAAELVENLDQEELVYAAPVARKVSAASKTQAIYTIKASVTFSRLAHRLSGVFYICLSLKIFASG